ncbi:MAG: hypothetical protein LH650_13030, partial [Chloroflexi bacterium]|nr:hypothetical protein [Chloroflexota bacterium]
TSPPYLGVVRYGRANWLRLWLLGEDANHVDAQLDTPRTATASSALLGQALADLRPALADDAIVVLILGDVGSDRGRRLPQAVDLAAAAWASAAEPLGYRLAGIVRDHIDPSRKLTGLWGERAGDATRSDQLLVIAPTELGVRRARGSASQRMDAARTLGVMPGRRPVTAPARTPQPAARRPAILGTHAADVPPGRPGIDGPARPDEEPRPHADDGAAPQLHPAAAGTPVPA